MELRQLEYFVAVAEEANFTRAAARVHVAQPGVSAQIRRLERELGEQLLDRSGRTVRLTEAGAAVLPYAKAALAAVAGAKFAVEELTGLLRGRVDIGVVTACGAVDLPTAMADFHELHPGVEVTLTEGNSADLLDAIRAGGLDLALVGLAGPPQGISTHVVVDERLVAAVSPDDPLADRSEITLDDLRDRALICLPRGTGVRTCLDDACAAAGIAPRVAFEASGPMMVERLALRGLGVAILPGAAGPGLHTLSITPELRSRLDFAWRSDDPIAPAARAFITHLRHAFPHSAAVGPSSSTPNPTQIHR
ncbi:LysR family transcriptional regulator [Allokutzneria sp. A3M-2-11 16]|uniref:LysR family transcriptional regulator n=1 Tax=Allokutzneria sp. A3M-2-11 16 TaxID=2962043 RepID=UPI0020B6EB74|nr:LysR family transcriptional regulator [Allokutzneria sp. A3M-2-11 16]MCP3804031.1 LysR family transcriptional regulator [Allokutzneria sp. A3M-2-11 16]